MNVNPFIKAMTSKVAEIISEAHATVRPRQSNKDKGFGIVVHLTDNAEPAFETLAKEFDKATRAAIIPHT